MFFKVIRLYAFYKLLGSISTQNVWNQKYGYGYIIVNLWFVFFSLLVVFEGSAIDMTFSVTGMHFGFWIG